MGRARGGPFGTGSGGGQGGDPALKIEFGSAYEDLGAVYGRFPVVLCTEVIEHLYYPRKLLRCVDGLLEPGGYLILSTPYHGYWKNLAMAISGTLENHYDVMRDHGHIKFFSPESLTAMLAETGFTPVAWRRVGRIAPLAKCMVALVQRTAEIRR